MMNLILQASSDAPNTPAQQPADPAKVRAELEEMLKRVATPASPSGSVPGQGGGAAH